MKRIVVALYSGLICLCILSCSSTSYRQYFLSQNYSAQSFFERGFSFYCNENTEVFIAGSNYISGFDSPSSFLYKTMGSICETIKSKHPSVSIFKGDVLNLGFLENPHLDSTGLVEYNDFFSQQKGKFVVVIQNSSVSEELKNSTSAVAGGVPVTTQKKVYTVSLQVDVWDSKSKEKVYSFGTICKGGSVDRTTRKAEKIAVKHLLNF